MRLKIRKTKMNIFWLLMVGVLVGVVIGIRQPVPEQTQSASVSTQGVSK